MIDDESGAKVWLTSLPECDGGAISRLDRLVLLLQEENKRQNLVSTDSLEHIWQRHIADSAQLLKDVPRETTSWLDIGSGGGFPGLVIGVLRPGLAVTLVEPRRRRAEWLVRAVDSLALEGVRVIAHKAEHLPDQTFDAISARAVAPLDALLALSARFSTSETLWRLPKGRTAQQEVDTLRGWDHLFHVEQSLTKADAGIIVGRLRGRKGARA